MDGRTAMSIAAQMHKDGNRQDLDSLQHERDQYMVASIAYIEKLIENTTNKRVIYTITDYLEIGTCLLEDGFIQCIRALLKEYKTKFPMATEAPYIKVELDPNNYFSPSLLKLISRGILLPVDDVTSFVIEYYYPDEQRLLTEHLDEIPMLLGCDKDGVEAYLSDYMKNLDYFFIFSYPISSFFS